MKNYDYYRAQLSQLVDLVNLYAEKKVDHLKQILFASVTLLGILISLHSTSSLCHSCRYLLVSGLALLSLSSLLTVLALRRSLRVVRLAKDNFRKELQSALREGREMNGVTVPFDKAGTFFEKTATVFLLSSIALLSCYGIISALD